MTKKILLLSISILLFTSNQSKFKKVTLDKNVSIKLPVEFVVMSDDDIAARYPAYRKPIAMYISPDRFADFGYNVSNGVWGNDIKLLRDVYKATINNSYNKVTFLRDTILTIKKRNYVEFEYVSEVEDKSGTQAAKPVIKTYTYTRYALQSGEIYIFTFNCPDRFKDKYRTVAAEIMASTKINFKRNKHKTTMMEGDKKNPNKGKQPENPFIKK